VRRFLRACVVAAIGVALLATGVLAAWEFYFPTTIVSTSTSARTNYPTLLGYGGQSFVDAGYILATGLDTNMQVGVTSLEYMLTTTRVATVIPNVPVGGQVATNLYTGFTPNQTNFPVIVGENGRVETPDAAALELAAAFDIEFDGYVDTSKVNHPLIYKPGAFLVDVSAAGTITAGAINVDSYEIVPGGFGAWQDIDVSAFVPDGASGVVVEIDTNNANLNTGVRKNGSTDDRRTDTEHYWAMIGIDDDEIFEVWLENATAHIYIRAYTDDNWTYNTNADDVSLAGALAWTDVDISTEAPDAVAAIIEIVNNDGVTARDVGVRMNASTDNRKPELEATLHTFRIVGLDDAQIFEGYVETLDVDFYLIGYVTGGATFATNATDKSLVGSGAWTNVDSSVEAPDATYLFFQIDSGGNGDGLGFRENGDTLDTIVTDITWAQGMSVVKADMNQIIEAYEEDHNQSSFYLAGYTEYGVYPSFPSPTYLVSSTVGGGILASGVKNIKITGGAGNLTLDVDGDTDVNAIGGGITNTTMNWRFMSTAISYMTDYYHTATAALRITYEPDIMLTGSTVADLTTAFDGTIAWGDNQEMSVAYGGMVGFESTDAVGADVGGFDMPSSPMPATWYGDASGVANLPAYDAFNSFAIDAGIPVENIYFWIIMGLAFGAALFIIVFTRSALLGVLALIVVLFIGSSQTIVPMWIPFVALIVDLGIMYLYRQVSY